MWTEYVFAVAFALAGVFLVIAIVLVWSRLGSMNKKADRIAETEAMRLQLIRTTPSYKAGYYDALDGLNWQPFQHNKDFYSYGYKQGKDALDEMNAWLDQSGSSNT